MKYPPVLRGDIYLFSLDTDIVVEIDSIILGTQIKLHQFPCGKIENIILDCHYTGVLA